jgi:hypothetical protein
MGHVNPEILQKVQKTSLTWNPPGGIIWAKGGAILDFTKENQ